MIEVLDENYLAVTGIFTVCYQLFFYFIAASLKFDKVTDLAGGTNFVWNVLITLYLGQSFYPRQILATTMVTVWGVRLSAFLFWRILKTGHDERFNELRENPLAFLGFWIYQMWWAYTGTLAVILLNANQTESATALSTMDYIGLAMFIIGFLFEAEADRAKSSFKSKPENRGKWTNISVWSVSRHPNYFGEMFLWWGVWLVCLPVMNVWWKVVLSVVGPIFTVLVLSGLSGMNLSEPVYNYKYDGNEDYAEYKRTVSILIPLPGCYACIPMPIKRIFLFEWKSYEEKKESMAIGEESKSGKV